MPAHYPCEAFRIVRVLGEAAAGGRLLRRVHCQAWAIVVAAAKALTNGAEGIARPVLRIIMRMASPYCLP